MTNDPERERVEVTQADREAAAGMGAEIGWAAAVCQRVRDGRFDDWPSIQAFARHRLAALRPAEGLQGNGSTLAPHGLVARLEEWLERIQEGDRPLPWVVHSGCSYRRIASEPTPESGFRSFPDGNVLHAYNQRSDGHPDLSMGEEQLSALVEIVNSLPAILTALRAQSDAHGPDGLPVDTSGERAAYLAGYEVGKLEAADSAQSDAEVEREALREALRVFVGCALPVAAEINPRGHNWCEPYLDQALTIAIEALERGKHRKDGV